MSMTPQWQPVKQLPLIAYHLDEMVDDAREQYQNLQSARARPYILDDYTVGRVIKVFSSQQNDLWLFEEQLRRWGVEPVSPVVRQEIERLKAQLVRLGGLLKDILALAEELKAGTIEKMLAKSEVELGLETLMGKWPGPDTDAMGENKPPKTKPKPRL